LGLSLETPTANCWLAAVEQLIIALISVTRWQTLGGAFRFRIFLVPVELIVVLMAGILGVISVLECLVIHCRLN
jgi:hypothetical protein